MNKSLLIDSRVVDPVCPYARLVPLFLLLDSPGLLLRTNCHFLPDSILPVTDTEGLGGMRLVLLVLPLVDVVQLV